MAEFKPIETQEELDKIIQKRLAQKDREIEERFAGYLSPDKVTELENGYKKTIEESAQQLADHDKVVADLTARAAKAEHSLLRHEVAASHGIPFELAGRLVGETKETLEKDADAFAAYLSPKTAAPMRSNEPAGVSAKDASAGAWSQMLSGLTNLN